MSEDPKKEVENAEHWVKKGDEFYKAENYEKAIKCYEKATELNPTNAYAFDGWGKTAFKLAKLKKGKEREDLFKSAFEKYEEAIRLYEKATDKTTVFYRWGNAIFRLAEINKDEDLFKSAFEKYEEATQLYKNPTDRANVFCNWGYAIFRLAEINKNENLLKKADEKYNKAIQLYEKPTDKVTTFFDWGGAIFRLAEINKDEDLFEEAFEKYNEAVRFSEDPTDKASIFCGWGYTISRLAEINKNENLFEEAFKKYANAVELDSKIPYVFYSWIYAISKLAEINKGKSLQENLETFERKSKGINDSDTLLIKGKLYFILYQTTKKSEYKKKVEECFKKSEKDILEILTFLDEEREIIIKKTRIFHSLLDYDSNDTFFKETTKNLTQEQRKNLDEYKEIYIRSIFIISLLHVREEEEEFVAHYREKDITQKLLFDDSKFRLNAIDYSNDPTEGKTLLDFLYGKGNYKTDEELNSEYEAFASSFTFDYDSLNQFRLYGKDGSKKEGTGLSLVFDEDFFDKKAKTAIGSPKTNSYNMNNDDAPKEEKSALFRCIYIDPTPEIKQPIVNVGRKEEYLFYREDIESSIEDIEDKFNNYNTKMNKIIKGVREEMTYLKGLVEKNLNTAIVGKLLLNLRYLVKHIAFKEEQECRIVKIFNLSKDKEKIKDDEFKQLYFEYPLAIPMYIDKIYFGPKAKDFELFKSMLKYKGLNIPCYKSENPLA